MRKSGSKERSLEISDAEFGLRIDSIKKEMVEEKIDLLILIGDEFNQGYIRYVSDYRPILEYAIVLISLDSEPILLCGPECKKLALLTSRIRDIKVCSDIAIPGEEYPNEEMDNLKNILKKIESKNKLNRVGIIDLNFIPNFLLKNILNVCSNSEIVNASKILNKLRAIKSESEIKIIKKAYEMAIEGLKKGLLNLDIGKSETEIGGDMSYVIWKMGAEQLSHTFSIASGINTSTALIFPSDNKLIEDGDFVILDIGAVYKGYFSDIATTRIVGKKQRDKVKVLDTAKKALEAAIKKVKPGIKGKDIDLAARDITSKAGFEKNHLYGVCHGVGLQHCEYPFFGPTSDIEVREGMFFTVDIGLFNFDFGGVRLENGILVKSNGCEVFEVDHWEK